MSEVVNYECENNIAIITIDNPPVNAISHAVRQGIWDAIEEFEADNDAEAVVLICAGRTFIVGADITEFGKPPQDPWLPGLLDKVEQSSKLVIVAMHGTALGGGFETALSCHYRCALASAKVGLPEVNLGLLPGAGGTQRLPRLAGVKTALDMILSGRHVKVSEACEYGIIDEIIEGDLREGALAYAGRLLESGAKIRRVSELQIDSSAVDANFFKDYEKQLMKRSRGFFSPFQILKCVKATVELPFSEAMAVERKLFDECMGSSHSKAQRNLFFTERTVTKIPDVPRDTPMREINTVAVIGAGTMGGGIAMNFANVGIPVKLLELKQDALDSGLDKIRSNYQSSVDKGRLTGEQFGERMGLISGVLDYEEIADTDLVVEAVFENMDIKKEVFAKLDEVCKSGAILATNTSTLDVNELASTTRRSEDVIGLHFFAPANVMPLLEVVRGEKTGKDVIATTMGLAKRIKKTAVLVGVCFGFVGNRMFIPYEREAQMLLLEGVSVERIDQVAYDWGMAMGPHAVCDLSGVDVIQKIVDGWGDKPDDPILFRMNKVLNDMGRFGQKTGAGFYKYEGRTSIPDPEVQAIVSDEAIKLDVEQRDISDEEIIERLLYSMINEGARILEEGIAIRSSDIDVIWTSGYGMPRYRGGPMMYADTVGLKQVYEAVCKYRDRYGEQYWQPAPLLEKLAKQGKGFADG